MGCQVSAGSTVVYPELFVFGTDMDIQNSLWTPDMATGINPLDHQLICCFDDLNRLAAATGNTAPSAFSAFEESLKAHFAEQAELMATVDYRAREAHCLEHEQLLAELQHQVLAVQEGVGSIATAARSLQVRLRRHVLAQDVLLGEAITQQSDMRDRRISELAKPPVSELVFGVDERRLVEMRGVEWSRNLETGIPLMDEDHRHLVSLYNDILLSAKDARQSLMEERLMGLATYMEAHFSREEGLMAGCPPELVAAHRREHQQLLAELSCQIEEWQERHISAAFLVRFLYQWLLRHIVVEDMAFAKMISGRR